MPRGKRSFGSVRKLTSGRWQARYTGPDGAMHAAKDDDGKPLTFDTKRDADRWLSLRQSEIVRRKWVAPSEETPDRPLTVQEYGDAWLMERELAILTRELYAALLKNHVYPTFGDTALATIKPPDVRTWHARLAKTTGPTARAHAYALLRTILNTALDDELITVNPCRIRGAGTAKRASETEPATVAELVVMVQAMPAKYQLMVLLAAWCAPRFGELAELRRFDVDVPGQRLHIRRSVAITATGRVVKEPKSEAGRRIVSIPPHLMPTIEAHLAEHAARGEQGLLFPGVDGSWMCEKTLREHWYKARKAAKRPDMRWHDLRHTGADLAASTGATLKDLMHRLGHSTVAAALRYQHKAQARDKVIAAQLSELAAAGNVTPISEAKGASKKSRNRRSA